VFEALHSSGSLESELDEEFAALDANGDGIVTLDEFKAALSCPVPARQGPSPLGAKQPMVQVCSAH
jgi:Ca2+-binding EF-hand superfamily protein